MRLLPWALGSLGGALCLSVAFAQEVITVCGASAGYGYYLEPKQQNWVNDGIKSGSLTLVRDTAGAYDVIIKDAMHAFSAKGDGARVVKVFGSDDQAFTLVAVYPAGTTEVYQLTLDRRGRGTLIWASLKNRVPPLGITKGTVLTAACSK